MEKYFTRYEILEDINKAFLEVIMEMLLTFKTPQK